MYGWTGKILHVDLNHSKITRFSSQPYAEKYLGGRGIATRIYWERVSSDVKAFDPKNLIIFMTGPLVATGAQGATRMSLVGKSPMYAVVTKLIASAELPQSLASAISRKRATVA